MSRNGAADGRLMNSMQHRGILIEYLSAHRAMLPMKLYKVEMKAIIMFKAHDISHCLLPISLTHGYYDRYPKRY